jgi:putative acetyltransferase
MDLRKERPGDREAVDRVNRLAFEQADEAEIVARLRESSAFIPELSIVADNDGEIVGHILFTRVELDPPADLRVISLAPMAVLPERQRNGVGSALVQRGLDVARDLGEEVVVLVGHPEYYPRFGFELGSRWGMSNPFPGTDEAFFAMPLRDGVNVPSGTVVYPPEFLG